MLPSSTPLGGGPTNERATPWGAYRRIHSEGVRPGGSKPGGSEDVGGRGADTETGAGADWAVTEEPAGTTPQYASCL